MNFGKIYSDATGRNDKIPVKTNPAYQPNTTLSVDGTSTNEESREKEALDETAAKRQLKQQWLDSTLTQEFIQDLNKQYNEYIDNALLCANGAVAYTNAEKIVTLLIRANEIKKIINNKPA